MRSIKITDYRIWLVIAFLAAFYLTRFPGLYSDTVNPDSVNWHFRSEQFMNGIKYFQWEKTYQHYQPGVTLMWIMGPTVELVKQFYPGHEVYNVQSFPDFHFFSRVVLLHVQLALTVWIFVLLKKFVDWKVAALAVTLFTFEPFFVGNSRELHMDVLLTLLLLIGLLYSFWSLKEYNVKRSLLAGFFLGLAFLTKSIGIGGILFAAGFVGVYKKSLKQALLILLPSLLTIFIFLPALWKVPEYALTQIYKGVTDGIEGGHGQIIFGEKTRDVGAIFYPLVLVLKFTPVLLLGVVMYLSRFKKRMPKLTLISYLAIFYIGYFVVITIGSKKIDRYILPMYPFLALLATEGYFAFKDRLKSMKAKVIGAVFVGIFLIWPLIWLRPYYFTYTNPLFGTPKFVHERVLAQKPFGIGAFAVRDYVQENFEPGISMAFWDPKPFLWLFDRDNVKYIESSGTRDYQVLVLGVNEEIPDKVKQGSYKFKYFGSVNINGLEYWKFYVRNDQKKY